MSKTFRPVLMLSALAVTLLLTAVPVALASGKGGGGGGGGGSTKPLTVRFIGNISAMEEIEGGVMLTIGVSYYNQSNYVYVPFDAKVKLNGDSSVSVDDLMLGDYADVTALWPSRVAVKVEVTGPR